MSDNENNPFLSGEQWGDTPTFGKRPATGDATPVTAPTPKEEPKIAPVPPAPLPIPPAPPAPEPVAPAPLPVPAAPEPLEDVPSVSEKKAEEVNEVVREEPKEAPVLADEKTEATPKKIEEAAAAEPVFANKKSEDIQEEVREEPNDTPALLSKKLEEIKEAIIEQPKRAPSLFSEEFEEADIEEDETVEAPESQNKVAPESYDAPETRRESGLKAFLARPLRGQQNLWKVYWLNGFLGAIILSIMIAVGFVATARGHGGMASILVITTYIAFEAWWGVSLWKCAWNANAKFWGYLVRIIAILMIPCTVLTVMTLSTMFAVGTVAENLATTLPGKAVSTVTINGKTTVTTRENGQEVVTVTEANPDPVQQQPNVVAPAPAALEVPVAPVATNPAPAGVPDYSVKTPVVATQQASPSAKEVCEKRMTDYAIQNHADAKTYIAKNQDYVKRCVEQVNAWQLKRKQGK